MNTIKFLYGTRRMTGILLLLMLLPFFGCNNEQQLGLPPQHSNPPPPPTIVGVENTYGAAHIKFRIEANNDLLAVTATYDINGIERTNKVSIFTNTIFVQGFGQEVDHERNYKVYLRTVDKHGNESSPVEVTVSPLQAPVFAILNSVEVRPSFRSLVVSWENPDHNNIIVGLAVQNEDGEWIDRENFYSNSAEGRGALRRLTADVPIRVGVTIRDRWDNFSQRHEETIIPWFDVDLDRTLFREVSRLHWDAQYMGAPRTPSQIWTPITGAGLTNLPGTDAAFHTTGGTGIGHCVTFDLGGLVNLSSYTWFDRLGAFIFTHNNVRLYDIYGYSGNALPNEWFASSPAIFNTVEESLQGWTLLYEAQAGRPSGGGVNSPVTDEDREWAAAGDFHEFPPGIPPVRYLRIHFKENWSGGILAQIRQIRFSGIYVE